MANPLTFGIWKALPVGMVLVFGPAVCPGISNSAWSVRAWQSDDGLPNNTVEGVVQTPDGYLWLGTPSGLVRFDGVRFEDFSPTNFIAPPNRGTRTMLLGRTGALWLGLDRGAVACLDGRCCPAFTESCPKASPTIWPRITLLPALSRAKQKALQTACLNNMKQLGLGMMIYVGDNNDIFAGAASANTYGPHLEDWIYWRVPPYTPTLNGVYMSLEKSPLLLLLGTVGKTNLFRCPMDLRDEDRVTQAQSGDGPYYYSYEFTSWDIHNG